MLVLAVLERNITEASIVTWAITGEAILNHECLGLINFNIYCIYSLLKVVKILITCARPSPSALHILICYPISS